MAELEPLILRIDLVDAFLVDKEVPIDWDDGNDWSMVEDLLLDSFFGGTDTIVRDFVSLAFLSECCTVCGGLNLADIIGKAVLINQPIDLSIV